MESFGSDARTGKFAGGGLALDIDDTLSWTVKHYVDILQEKFGNPDNLTAAEILEKYRHTHKVPYWQTKEALNWIEQNMYSNKTQEAIPLIKDANVVVKNIHSHIPIKAYITARPETVAAGTRAWLQRHGFPEANLVTRSGKEIKKDGNIWKAEVLFRSYPSIVGIVDDNVGLVKALPSDYPGVVFLYGHASKPPTHVNVIPCATWHDVLHAVTTFEVLAT